MVVYNFKEDAGEENEVRPVADQPKKEYKHDSALEDWEDEFDYLGGTIFPRWG